MRILFIATFMANLALTLVSLVLLPPRIAIHFKAGGVADGWGSNAGNAILMTGAHLVLFCLFYFGHRLTLLFPTRWVNLPNKEYWLNPANQPRTMEKMQVFMWQLGTAMFLFFFIVGLLAFQANLAQPARLDERFFLSALGAFFLYTAWWAIAFFRAFRIPRPKHPTAP